MGEDLTRARRVGVGGASLLTGLLFLALFLFPAFAQAASPLKIREVFPGSVAAGSNAELVELQMTGDGQNDIDGQVLRFYDATGVQTSTFTIPSDVANGGSQRTVLLATAAASTVGATSPDFTLSAVDRISPAGGAVCFTGSGFSEDCVTWGSIPLQNELSGFPNPQSANEAAIGDGSSLHRLISPGCSTYLDSPDDSNNSATDFSQAAPSPRSNAVTPTEQRCAPDTQILTFPPNPTNETEATFAYAENPAEPGATFECALDWAGTLDSGDFSSCPDGGVTYPGPLSEGNHKFAVRADGEGGTDPTADTHSWTIDTTAPETSIESFPPSPSSGFSAPFTYDSSEPASSFRCQLDSGPITVCSATGKTYFSISTGSHVFRVWAKDNAGNEDPTAAEHVFEVQTDLGDFTPPDTSITASPSSLSLSPTASFSYSSSEPGSSFECRLGGGFSPCPASGTTYNDLPNGSYTFEVRATDTAGNVDSVPAAYSWQIKSPAPDTKITKAPAGNIRAKGKAVKVRFSFNAPGAASYRCRLDLTGPYKSCKSPYSLKVKAGRHVFEVFGVDRLGNEEGTPAFRIFTVQAPGAEQSFFVQSGRFLNSLTAEIAPTTLPRDRLVPVSLSFASTFENLDGSDIPGLETMTMRLAKGGVVSSVGLPKCSSGQLAQRTAREALGTCGGALVGKGTVSTALRFPEGSRLRSTASLLLFNAPGGLLMHVYTTKPVEGTFIIPLRVKRTTSGTQLSATFPRIAAGYGQVTGFQMTLSRTYTYRGERRSYLLANCPIPKAAGLNKIAFQLAKVTYRFQGGLRIANSSINVCRAKG